MDKPPLYFRDVDLGPGVFMLVNEEAFAKVLGECGVTWDDMFDKKPKENPRISKALKRAVDEKLAVLVKNVKVD